MLQSFYYKVKVISAKPYIMLTPWFLITVFATYKKLRHLHINNYYIFKYTYFHAKSGLNLYDLYPSQYFDSNHYGPFFSLIMAPFALLPDHVGTYLWQIVNMLLLYVAIQQLPFSQLKRNLICLICSQELLLSLYDFQTNGAIAALLILSWVCIEKKMDFWAALFIMIGFFVKIYGIVGVAFFLFSRQKGKFILSLCFWALVLFLLPMLSFSPKYILQSYQDWFHILTDKNIQNIQFANKFQDMCVPGMIRRILNMPNLSELPIVICGAILFLFPACYISKFNNLKFRILFLASVLLFPVLFSSGSERCTYIIALVGVGVWLMAQQQPLTGAQIFIFCFAIYLGTLPSTDLFPNYLHKHYYEPYVLKALPYFIVWLRVIYEMVPANPFRDFSLNNVNNMLSLKNFTSSQKFTDEV